MSSDSSGKIKTLKVDGGASKNDFLMQFQADILNVDVIRKEQTESTALGAALLSGLAVGFFKDLEDLKKKNKVDKIFKPNMSDERREELLKKWHKAINYAKDWAKN